MFVLLNGLYDKPVLVNFDLVTHVRQGDNGNAKIYTTCGYVEVNEPFDKLANMLLSNTKRR